MVAECRRLRIFDAFALANQSRFTFGEAAFTGGAQVGVDIHCANLLCSSSLPALPPHFAGLVFDFAGNANGAQRRDALFFSPFGGAFPAQQTFGTDYISTMRAVFGFEKTFLDGLAVGGLPFSIQPVRHRWLRFRTGQFQRRHFLWRPLLQLWAAVPDQDWLGGRRRHSRRDKLGILEHPVSIRRSGNDFARRAP